MEHIIKKMQDKGLLDDLTAERVRNNISDGTELDLALLNLSGLPEEEVLRFLAEEFQYPFMSLDQYNPSKDFLSQFPARILMNRKVLPMEGENGTMIVASSRIFDTSGVDELRLATGKDFRLVLAPSSEID
ncbi:MAG: hypothetical protein JRJ23_08240, partial [Deltaproteobacteria bacterium]|nr:hypothetical protein [Deltaproteobacteria bacterium]